MKTPFYRYLTAKNVKTSLFLLQANAHSSLSIANATS